MSVSEPHEQEVQVTLALQELLAGGPAPIESSRALTGDVKACLDALVDALQSGGLDENNASESARFLAFVDIIQQTFHCTILIVHHEGKDTQRGPRGSSALKGNTETVIGLGLPPGARTLR